MMFEFKATRKVAFFHFWETDQISLSVVLGLVFPVENDLFPDGFHLISKEIGQVNLSCLYFFFAR
jgi:hypothetical protein